jgi:hypothetical protein
MDACRDRYGLVCARVYLGSTFLFVSGVLVLVVNYVYLSFILSGYFIGFNMTNKS